MFQTFIQIFGKSKNYLGTISITFVVFTVLRIVPVYGILKGTFITADLSLGRKFGLLYEYIFQSFTGLPLVEQSITIGLSLATAINIILFIIFARNQRKVLSKRSFAASISGMFLGLFGIGCLSCGVLIMAPLLTFLGLGAYLTAISSYALWISIGGGVLVLASILYLLKKLSQPLVCK